MTDGDLATDAVLVLVVSTVGGERRDRAIYLIEQRADLEASSILLVVNTAAAIRPVSVSTAMCSLRHDRRVFVPRFSSSQSPDPQSFSRVADFLPWNMTGLPPCRDQRLAS